MEDKLRGKVIVLGNNIDTDQIYPGRFLELVNPEEVGSHCLAGVDENIAKNFRKGDVIVAGTNFGCGSSREHAPISLLNMGASCVIADSFARIFFRNSINLGLPLIVCKGISSRLNDGDEIEVSIKEGTVTLVSSGEVLNGEKIGEYAMKILNAGGIKPLFRAKMKEQQ
ncbi:MULTISPECIES: LeuD/DmdB family oxidoreductase small subunit [unclassified Sedimentibacter]|uniref:LeuD/DmdB family oxidoreductase small subunit n=1 Tax=unclassified Sedimentibacter TaxID=2649220 RepID=UPI001BD3A645|nr:3-isopropylmalate dehydratase small subunit [Sedimentibacter sp. MB35-C1]WMJ77220.1 3-isopropylmalate dehydratase small subunit [Sedimentibacter sp. MB35-C1]